MNTAGAWLWSRVSETVIDAWWCHACQEAGSLPSGNRESAQDHVVNTGHTITIRHTHDTVLTGMATCGSGRTGPGDDW